MKIQNLFHALALSFPVLLASYATAGEQTPPTGSTLTVNVQGLKTATGTLVVNIFRAGDDLFGKPFLKQTAAITAPATVVTFRDLPADGYAVFAFHDENSNGTLDPNWLHFPKEPMGYSNDWYFGLFTGMPTFEKTKFAFTNANSVVTITLK